MEINPSDFVSYYEWFDANLLGFGMSALVGLLVAAVVGWIASAVRYGPIEGTVALAKAVFAAATRDWPGFSFRRTGAIARLAFREAIRRKVLVVFGVAAVVFLFAGIFLDTASTRPARLYLSFSLTATTYIAVFLALFLAVFSLPSDIQNRTIYTVVTKPVRAGEIVLGRFLGFLAIVSIVLAGMGLLSYQLVVRGLRHEHQLDGALEAVATAQGTIHEGRTTFDRHHRHRFTIGADGTGTTEPFEHWHVVRRVGDGPKATIEVGPPVGALVARVPKYGRLQFYDRDGKPTKRGINVGNLWEYRSYIEGGTKSAAEWTFDGVYKEDFPDGTITIALNLSVYRSYIGDYRVPVRGVLYVMHPDPAKNLISEPIPFFSTEFEEQLIVLPATLKRYRPGRASDEELRLFDDLISKGRLKIKLQCDDVQQYFGVAQADVYIRRPDAAFAWNFAKGVLAIWLQVVTIISLAVLFSTFVKAPVALLSTVGAFILGYFRPYIRDIALGKTYGGGPVESFVRMIQQNNLVSELGLPEPIVWAIRETDRWISLSIDVIASAFPTFQDMLHMTEYVAYGIDIPGALIARFGTVTFCYFVVYTLVGYFLLRSRELAA